MLLSLTSFHRGNATLGKENKMGLSIKYIDAILRFIVKRVSRWIARGSRYKMRFPRARASYPFFLYSGRNTQDRKSSEGERKGSGAKGILDPWLLTFRKSLSSIISRGSRFPDVGCGKLRQTWAVYMCVCTLYLAFARVCDVYLARPHTQTREVGVYLYDVPVIQSYI